VRICAWFGNVPARGASVDGRSPWCNGDFSVLGRPTKLPRRPLIRQQQAYRSVFQPIRSSSPRAKPRQGMRLWTGIRFRPLRRCPFQASNQGRGADARLGLGYASSSLCAHFRCSSGLMPRRMPPPTICGSKTIPNGLAWFNAHQADRTGLVIASPQADPPNMQGTHATVGMAGRGHVTADWLT
jgi:hypothetical protein